MKIKVVIYKVMLNDVCVDSFSVESLGDDGALRRAKECRDLWNASEYGQKSGESCRVIRSARTRNVKLL